MRRYCFKNCGVIFTILFTLLFTIASAQEGDPAVGEKLFKANCASCHKLDKRMTGPALRGVTELRSREWLHSWIKDNVAFRASGDPEAKAIFDEYKGSPMNTFPQLSDADIDNILAYTAQEKPAEAAAAPGAADTTASSGGNSNGSMTYILIALTIVLLVLVFLLNKLTQSLKAEDSDDEEKKKTDWKELFRKNTPLVVMATIVMIIISLYWFYTSLMAVDINKDYQPIQPIYFSHKIHAGDNKIDCKYCHSAARVSKHAGIPSVNVCMNCHKYIQEYNGETYDGKTKEFYDAEIQKIYKAIGYDPAAAAYIEGYQEKPIKWVKIHNLQDFVYFNHSQHNMVGNIECQTCHGPVEEMQEVKQFSDLTMGWCINCHRTTNVDVQNNAFYEKVHEQLAKKYGVEEVTVDMIGGLECGKCHY